MHCRPCAEVAEGNLRDELSLASRYGDPPPKTVIVVGMSREFVESAFESCQIAGHVSNRFGIENSVIRNTDIFLCHSLRQSWPLFWQGYQYYG